MTVSFSKRITHFLFLNTTLKTRQTMANAMPAAAKISSITTSSVLKVFMTFIGVPSRGTPPASLQTIILHVACIARLCAS